MYYAAFVCLSLGLIVCSLYTLTIYQMCANVISYARVFESYRITDIQTDTFEIIYRTALWVVRNNNMQLTKTIF